MTISLQVRYADGRREGGRKEGLDIYNINVIDYITSRRRLQRIDEIRPRIPQLLHLLLRLPFGPIIPPATPPLLILPLQQKIHQHASAEQEDGQIGQHDAVALSVQGAGSRLVDVGGDDAVEVAPADDEAHRYTAFVYAFGVVGSPDDDVGDAGIHA